MKKSGFSNAFREESDDDTCGTANNNNVGRVNSLLIQRSAAAEQQASKIHSDALAEDPFAFDYDDAYDSFKVPVMKPHTLSHSDMKEEAPVRVLGIMLSLYPTLSNIVIAEPNFLISESEVCQKFDDNSKRSREGKRSDI